MAVAALFLTGLARDRARHFIKKLWWQSSHLTQGQPWWYSLWHNVSVCLNTTLPTQLPLPLCDGPSHCSCILAVWTPHCLAVSLPFFIKLFLTCWTEMSLKTRSRRDPWSTIMACLSQHYMLDLKLINTRNTRPSRDDILTLSDMASWYVMDSWEGAGFYSYWPIDILLEYH